MPRPRIVKGRGISGAMRYVMGEGLDPVTEKRRILEEGGTPRAEILGGQNFGFAITNAADLELARRTMEWNGLPQHQASPNFKCENDCLHLSISWAEGATVSDEEMTEAAQSLLKSLGMENAQAVFVAHHDTQCPHVHIVASRIDPETGKTYSQDEERFKAQAWSVKWEMAHGREQHENRQRLYKIAEAIEAHNLPAIAEAMTERSPTFTARELETALASGGLDRKERAEFKAEIFAHENVIGLREKIDGPITRYTTREVLASEMALQRNASILADHDYHGLSKERIDATAAAHTLKPEQAEALAHLTGAKGFVILWGEAGTGKSHTLNAARAAYEAEGVNVMGLSWTNKVVQAMRGNGFTHAETIASELKKIENGRGTWDRNTVLIVDEAAMVSTDNLAKLAAAARQSGAKLILAGDDKQLGAIERGGMFETLRQSHGAAILKDVQRVSDVEQKRVFGEMHEGEFLGALQLSDQASRLHWTDKQADTVRAMTEAYTRDVTADPNKRRFMFAFTNAEVDALNDFARGIFKQRGDLGADREIQTAYGAKEFATGDRVMFSGGGRTAAEKRAGLINGNAGTITEIDTTGPKPCVTVQLDTGKGQEPQSITFTVGDDAKAGEFDKFKRGYAGTIYKGQGDTLDQTYVCHSSLWKNSAAYVALTRHRENVEIFASRETVRGMEKAHQGEAQTTGKDLEIMARGLGRAQNKRAATAYHIDNAAAVRADLESMVATLADPREQKRSPAAIINFEPRAAAPAVAEARGEAEEALTGHDTGRALGGIADALGSVASGAARLADGVADFAAKGIEALADLFGGASPAPIHQRGQDAPPPDAPEPVAPSRGPETPEEYTQEILQRIRALDALAQTQGAGRVFTSEEDAQLEQEAAVKKKRQEQSL
jgi:hypothetical protein